MSSTTETAAGLYQCGICKAEYGRSDHLVRHVRSHTKQRPFICRVCGKAFARQDLLKRHVSTHDKDQIASSNAEATSLNQLRQHSHRVQQACRSCAAKKVKCTNEKPCKRCRESGLPCDYEQGLLSPMQGDENHENNLHEAEEQYPGQQLGMLIPPAPMEHVFENGSELGLLQHNNTTAVIDFTTVNMQSTDHASACYDVMQDILDSTLTLPDFGDFIEIDADPILGEADFSFLNDASLVPAQPFTANPPAASLSDASPISTTTGVVAEAYRRSRVHRGWEPGREGNNDLEHQNLNLPLNTSPECLDSSRPMICMAKKLLSFSMRDRILAMILRTASSQAAERAVASFPSLEVMRDLIHFAFVRMADLQAISVIHASSLDLNEQRPELLAAFIAYGSICSPSHSLRKFGYAVQESVRVAINQLVEDQHAALREQDVCQAFYTQLYLGYYSAIGRKIEMAESNSMLGATLLRRGKMLQGHNYAPPGHFLSLFGLSVHEQWLKWAEQESRRRLVYFAFTLDAHISASRNISPLLPYSELETPLPSARKLWEAESAIRWRDMLHSDMELRTQQPPSLGAILRRPSQITAHRSIADVQCTNMAFLAGFWGLVYEYQQMNAVLRPMQAWNDFVLNSRYSELNTTMEQFSAELTDLDDVSPEVLILQEFMGVHTDVSFYELSKYAGIGTDEDAQLAVSYVQKWFESPQSRSALWHAGQIFRVTRLLPKRSLTDIYVIALYHAAITLWVWGLLFRTQGAPVDVSKSRVALDGDESPAVTRYLKASRTLPGLTSSSGDFMPLDNLTAAPDLANDIIMANWCAEPLPLTAEEVSRLMQGISGICRQRFKAVPA